METQRICPSCHKPLAADVPLGLCPECLLKAGLGTGAPSRKPGGESGFVPPAVEELQELFPQLEILELIGKGGMGAVYKARQRTLDRLVALKILPPGAAEDPGFAERFNREARALARLCHPHIVAVHDFGQVAGQPYLVMEYVDGLNLRQAERAGRLTPEQALAIIPQICEALQFAHNEGVVHRDIKPENILLDRKGRVKITDFGIAKILGAPAGTAALTGAKDVLGTPHYMAPEQLEKPTTVDHRADIYSLGVVFYEMLTGELPLGKFQPPSKKVQVDVRLDEVVLHTLEKEPERRYQHASEVKSDVETIATTPPSSSSGRQSAPSEDQSRLTSAATTSFRRLQEKAAIFFIAAACFLVATVWFASKPQVIPALLSGVGLIGFGIAGFRHARTARRLQAAIQASQPGATGAGSQAGDAALARAREEVKNPASWLVATGILNWIAIPFIGVVIAAGGGPNRAVATAWLLAMLAGLVLSGAILLAGLKMKRLEAYSLAILGSILAIFITPGNIIGLPVGIWCLVVLCRRDVREAFQTSRPASTATARHARSG